MKDLTQEVLEDPTVHYWVKDTLKKVIEKDPVDVLHGLELLKRIIESKLYWKIGKKESVQ